MKTVKVEYTVSFRISGKCDVSVPDDFDESKVDDIKGQELWRIEDEITEHAADRVDSSDADVDDWFVLPTALQPKT